MSGTLDLGDGNTLPIGEDGLATHTYAAAGDYVMTFTPDDGAAAVSTTVSAVDAPPPPVENITYNPYSTADYVSYFYSGSPRIVLAAWNGAAVCPSEGTPVEGGAEGARFTGIDGNLYIFGAFVTTNSIMGTPLTDEYAIGQITYT